MKILLLFYLLIFSLRAEVCSDSSRAVLASQKHFIESSFLPNLFRELIDIVQVNKIKIRNTKAEDIILQWDDDARNPHVVNLFEVANVFDVNVSDLFKHYGNLESFIDPLKVATTKSPLTPKKRYRITERIHLHLSGLISETLLKKKITLKELAFQTNIKFEDFHRITIHKGIPRLFSLLQILVRLDADVVDFFRRIDTGSRELPFPRNFSIKSKKVPISRKIGKGRVIENYSIGVYDEINRELKEIFESMERKKFSSDALRFRRMIYERHYKVLYRDKQNIRRKLHSSLTHILQTARMLKMHPSALLKHVGDLKSHAHWDGIGTRTFLSDEKIEELFGHIHRNLLEMFRQSEMTMEELAKTTQFTSDYLIKVIERGLIRPNFSILEHILRVLDSDTIHFFEKLESMGILDVHAVNASSFLGQRKTLFGNIQADNDFMGKRMLEIKQILLSTYSYKELQKAAIVPIYSNSDTYFKRLYRFSRVSNMSLSDLISERPIKTLIDPRHAKVERVPNEEIEKAKKLLSYLLLNETRRQRDISDLTITGLAIKSHLHVSLVRRYLSGHLMPSYANLRKIVENGLGIPLPHFLENFEARLKLFKHTSPASIKKTLLELEGLYLSKNVKTRMKELQERIDKVVEFFKSNNISLEKIYGLAGIRIRLGERKEDMLQGQVQAVIKYCHFLGISFRDFLGRRDFSELVNVNNLNFERLSDEQIRLAVRAIKRNIDQRRETLNISIGDLEIMLGASEMHNFENYLLNESSVSFPWYRYFQLTEILAREGEDDFFLLDGIDI